MAEKITLLFLGTGSAIPTSKRNHPAMLLTYKDNNFLFDCGEGTQRQFRKAKKSIMKLDNIFLTHWHGDHSLGLPGVLQTLSMNGYNKSLEIHGPKKTKESIETIKSFFLKSYTEQTDESKSFRISGENHAKGTILENNELKIDSFPLFHTVPAIGYIIELKEKLRLNKEKIKALNLPGGPHLKELAEGIDIVHNERKIKSKDVTYKEPAKKVAYILDTMYDSSIVNSIKGVDTLVIESTFLDKDKTTAKNYKHLTAKQAAKIAKQAKVKILVLIHISQRYEQNLTDIKKEAEEVFKGKIILPKDLDSLVL